jgi:AraC-like DNA-binding protein
MSRLDAIRDWEDRARTAGYHAPELARQVGIGEHQLRRYLTGRFGLPSQHWIDHVRIREACRLLMAGEPVKSIAFGLGFKQVSHFCTFFKRACGISPSAWRLSSSDKNVRHR